MGVAVADELGAVDRADPETNIPKTRKTAQIMRIRRFPSRLIWYTVYRDMKMSQNVRRIVQLQLPEQVADRLRELILAGELPPGRRLVERDIAEFLGVSRTPVREALFRLQGEGLVSALGNRGLCVCPLNETEISEIYYALAALERTAVRHMTISARVLAELARANSRFASCAGNVARATSADAAWHETLTGHSSNQKLLDLLQPLRALSARYERAFFGADENFERSLGEHAQIEALLREGDVIGAGDAVELHWLGNIEPMRAAVANSASVRLHDEP